MLSRREQAVGQSAMGAPADAHEPCEPNCNDPLFKALDPFYHEDLLNGESGPFWETTAFGLHTRQFGRGWGHFWRLLERSGMEPGVRRLVALACCDSSGGCCVRPMFQENASEDAHFKSKSV